MVVWILFACSKPKHVMDYRNLSGNWLASEKVVFIEVQTGTYFGEDDIVRIEDDYNRA